MQILLLASIPAEVSGEHKANCSLQNKTWLNGPCVPDSLAGITVVDNSGIILFVYSCELIILFHLPFSIECIASGSFRNDFLNSL